MVLLLILPYMLFVGVAYGTVKLIHLARWRKQRHATPVSKRRTLR